MAQVLIETMRREGFELMIGPPTVIEKEMDGVRMEPFELVDIDLPEEYSGAAISMLNERKGTMVTGTLQRFEGDNIIVDLNKTEAILPRHERVRTETYNIGDRLRANIVDVRKVGHLSLIHI